VALGLGAVFGPLLQIRQPELWSAGAYIALLVLGLGGAWLLRSHRIALALLAAVAAFGGCGWRAASFATQALDPALEGRDLLVTGVVAAMPQRNELGQRFRFEVEQAQDARGPVRLPPLVSLAWYWGPWAPAAGSFEDQRSAPELRAGERWRLAVRVRAPHGTVNPHGFDYELWLWEQGVQATGAVRARAGDEPPRRLAQTWAHPVEQARQAVRDAILARIGDRQAAGVVAALVTGDQNAIDVPCLLSRSPAPSVSR
jgi:competence protein ComEC